MARRSKRKSRAKRRRKVFLKILKSKFFWLFFLFIIVCLGITYLLLVSDVFQVKEVLVTGNERVNQEEILEVVAPLLEREARVGPFFLFSSKSIFLVNSISLEKNIKSSFPRIGEVSVKRKLPGTLSLEVKERRAFAEICLSSGKCYKSDEKGVVFEKSADVKEDVEGGVHYFQLKREDLVIVLKGFDGFELGSEVLTPLYLSGSAQIKNRVKNSMEMEPVEIALDGDQLVVTTKKGFKIYFDLDKDIEDQLFNLELVLGEKISEEELKELEYIDLRFGNRVYYK